MEDLSLSYSSLNIINSDLSIEEKIDRIIQLFNIKVNVADIEIDFTDLKIENFIEDFSKSFTESSATESSESSVIEQSIEATTDNTDNVQEENSKFKSFINCSDDFYSRLLNVKFVALEHANISSIDFLSFSLAGICLRICLDEGEEFASCEKKLIKLVEQLKVPLNRSFKEDLFSNSESEIKFLLLFYGVDLSKNLLATVSNSSFTLAPKEEDEIEEIQLINRKRCNYIRSLFIALFIHFRNCLKTNSFPEIDYDGYLTLEDTKLSLSIYQEFADVETEAILYINEFLNSSL